MIFVSESKLHVYLLWVNACLVQQCLNSVLNVKMVVAAFNQEKALVRAFSVITNLRMELFEALVACVVCSSVTIMVCQCQCVAAEALLLEARLNTQQAAVLRSWHRTSAQSDPCLLPV